MASSSSDEERDEKELRPRQQRAAIAHDTLAILARGWYTAPLSGARVNIGHLVRAAEESTVLYTDTPEVPAPPLHLQTDLRAMCRVWTTTTLQAAFDLAVVEEQRAPADRSSVAVLNFASGTHPGGGFKRGSPAQEESLARASGLYNCLISQQDYYEANRTAASGFYENNIIFSPDVPVFRDDDGNLLEKPYLASFITVPAVNSKVVLTRHEGNQEAIDEVMTKRAARVIAVAASNNCKVLVLGAWGCGVFRGSSERMASIFFRLLISQRMAFHFRTIIFAIPDGPNVEPFTKRFPQSGPL